MRKFFPRYNLLIAENAVNQHTLFKYQIITEDNKKGLEVNIKSKILQVDGFPFKVFVGEDVNTIVDDKIRNRMVVDRR